MEEKKITHPANQTFCRAHHLGVWSGDTPGTAGHTLGVAIAPRQAPIALTVRGRWGEEKGRINTVELLHLL